MINLIRFVTESNAIEGIYRDPTQEELQATEEFLDVRKIDVDAVCELQAVYAPGMPLRTEPGMDVRVGKYVAPPGGPEILLNLTKICKRVSRPGGEGPWYEHCRFEMLHPFLDGNGRTGRALWAWHMISRGQDPFLRSFLHTWYYQTLENSR